LYNKQIDMNFLNFNLNSAKITDGEFLKSSDFEDQIAEESGSFTLKDEVINFDCQGLDICIIYDLDVSGDYEEDNGDYWTPPSCDVYLRDVEVTITQMTIDEYDVELTPQLKQVFSKLILEKI
jgi:hypothetical protein